MGSQSRRPHPTAGPQRLEALAALVARVRLHPFNHSLRHALICQDAIALRCARDYLQVKACLTDRWGHRDAVRRSINLSRRGHLQGMQEVLPMAVGWALNTVDSREGMAAVGLSKGAMEGTAMAASLSTPPSKVAAGTSTMPAATLAEGPADWWKEVGSLIAKACTGILLMRVQAESNDGGLKHADLSW